MDCTIAVITMCLVILIGLYQSRRLNTTKWQIEQLQQEIRNRHAPDELSELANEFVKQQKPLDSELQKLLHEED